MTNTDTISHKRINRMLYSLKRKVTTRLVMVSGCGGFDGGCVLIAKALHAVIGGELMVLVRKDDFAEHAAVLYDGRLFDLDGGLPPNEFINSFNSKEVAQSVGFRPMRSDDLTDAIQDDNLKKEIQVLFDKQLVR